MLEINKIKKRAKKSLKKKWNKKNQYLGAPCSFCGHEPCFDCLCPKILCDGIRIDPYRRYGSLLGAYWINLRKKDENSQGHIYEVPEADMDLMKDAMKDLAETGKINSALYGKIVEFIKAHNGSIDLDFTYKGPLNELNNPLRYRPGPKIIRTLGAYLIKKIS